MYTADDFIDSKQFKRTVQYKRSRIVLRIVVVLVVDKCKKMKTIRCYTWENRIMHFSGKP